ncbi:uncharacterized mitochondrial protein AtMg00810-like [Lycium barbarum]|uniref:uncharacterized mitochondrial protein AtMg00810-like n=1 Tax=Lycium barbarum TaxID=112863 RepID=UPI00293E9009|nr:uncharacterized mitochondrial protein AtMg00810-like [Lycium barbarum]
MKDLGQLHFYFGIEVMYFDGGIHLNQSKYATELLKKTNIIVARAVGTSLAQKHGLHEAKGSPVNASTPNSEHFQAVKRILKYVKGTVQLGLTLIAKSPLRLYGFSYAYWGGCTTTRRLTTGYTIYFGANCISWASKKQHTVARSSAEVEYRH